MQTKHNDAVPSSTTSELYWIAQSGEIFYRTNASIEFFLNKTEDKETIESRLVVIGIVTVIGMIISAASSFVAFFTESYIPFSIAGMSLFMVGAALTWGAALMNAVEAEKVL
jgi:hypothetical protein